MRTVVVSELGGPGIFTIVQSEPPKAGAGELVVDISVSGVNFIDVYHRTGVYLQPLPFRAGVEAVGVVTAVGDGVTDFVIGQRVGWPTGGQGSFSEQLAIAADKVVPLPDDVDDVTAVALLMQGVTAHYLATDTFVVQPGDVALVHAAAGGVGQLLTQLVKLRGGRVIATASTEHKRALAIAAGADHALPYEDFPYAVRTLTHGEGVHVVYDGVGAATAEGDLVALRVRGTLVFFGNASGPVPPLDLLRLTSAGSLCVTRPTIAHYARTPGELRARTAELFRWVREGVLHVEPPTRYALADIAAAFTALETRQTTGKLVLMH
ncbi:MAG: quinone oxidoreductase family protein [Candidatus Nanopelagicales bacterium]